ncbi:MAG: hypothetical protein HY055_10955 [Magnetospirillum sp.]|nr:hypothetical protein [Magnetospirillum sp.]
MKTRVPAVVPSLASLLFLGACASEPPMTSGMGGWVKGAWIVTDAFAAGGVTDPHSAPRGQVIRLEAESAGDAAGRICPGPSYGESQDSLAAFSGAGAPDWPGMGGMVTILEVTCAGQPFARYAVLADGSMLTRYGAWLLRLEQGEKLAANPAPMSPEPAMAPVPVLPISDAAPPPASAPVAAAPPKLVYLASYRTEAWAKKGWGILMAQSPSLKGLEPVTHPVEIKGKGKFVRLFAAAKDDQSGAHLCKELGKTIKECGIKGRDK